MHIFTRLKQRNTHKHTPYPTERSPEEVYHTEPEGCRPFFSSRKAPPPADSKTHSPAPVHEIWNKDELYTTPAHLTCQIYTPYAAEQELLRQPTCSPMWQGSDASFRCPPWFILPQCIIDTFNLSCLWVFDLSLQASRAGCIIECTLWFVSV